MITTVIDLSSDDETPIQKGISSVSTTTTTANAQEQRNQQQQLPGQRCQISPPKSKRAKNDNYCNKLIEANKEYEFIDHVVTIWLSRVQSGYKNLEMPDHILKAKAKEAANVCDFVHTFSENDWYKGFQERIKKMENLKQPIDIDTENSTIFRIEVIVKKEKPKFFKNCTSKNNSNGISLKSGKLVFAMQEENLARQMKEIEDTQQKQLSKMLEDQKKHLEKVKEAQRQQMEQIKRAQKQRDENVRKQEEMKIAELHKQKSHQISKPTPPASATKVRFGVLRKPEATKKDEAKGAVPLKPLTTSESVTLFEVIEVDDVLDDPIQSYEEALDCLTLVENYFLSTRNLKAVVFVNQIENFLKNQIDS